MSIVLRRERRAGWHVRPAPIVVPVCGAALFLWGRTGFGEKRPRLARVRSSLLLVREASPNFKRYGWRRRAVRPPLAGDDDGASQSCSRR